MSVTFFNGSYKLFLQWANYTQSSCSEVFPTFSIWDAANERMVHSHIVKKGVYSILTIFMFLLPIIIIIICYTLIVAKLYFSKPPATPTPVLSRFNSRRKVMRMGMVVFLVFLLCWCPLQLLMYTAIFHTDSQVLNTAKNAIQRESTD